VRDHADLWVRALAGGPALELDLAPEPLPVRLDPGRLVQVLLNLVVNARQAAPHGRVAVRTRATTRRGTGFAVLEVEDDGCGITPELVERIFDPFFTTRPDGSGVGLATVRRIVRGHGGRIEVRSDPGLGTTFRIELPLAE
jgi:signal transduction histidine kinase